MKTINEIKLKYENFIGKIEAEKNIIKPKYSLHENIKNAYEKFLPEEAGSEIFFYKNSKESFEKLKTDYSKNDELSEGLKQLIDNFFNYYEKLDKDNEAKVISMQNYIKIKEKDYEFFNIEEVKKEKEKAELLKSKDAILEEIDLLYSKLDDTCRDYIEKIKTENIKKLKNDVSSISERFFSDEPDADNPESDYENTEEFKESVSRFKQLYKCLRNYENGISLATEDFKKSCEFEHTLKAMKEIQNKIFEKVSELSKTEEQLNKIEDFIDFGRSFRESIDKASRELEEQKSRVENDEEVQKLGSLVIEFLNSSKILN